MKGVKRPEVSEVSDNGDRCEGALGEGGIENGVEIGVGAAVFRWS